MITVAVWVEGDLGIRGVNDATRTLFVAFLRHRKYGFGFEVWFLPGRRAFTQIRRILMFS